MVSVIIPAKNAEKTLAIAVNSVLNQSVEVHEIIVVNDHSSDNTLGVAFELRSQSQGKVTVVDNIEFGVSHARNYGVSLSTGKLIAFLDADDSWKMLKLEYQIPAHADSKYPNISFTYADYLNSSGEVIGSSKHFNDELELAKYVYYEQEIPGILSSWMMSRSTFDFIEKFDSRYKYAQDYEFFFRGLKKGGEFTLVPEYLVNYYVNPTGVSTKFHIEQKAFAFHAQYFKAQNLVDPEVFVKSNEIFKYISRRELYASSLIRNALCLRGKKFPSGLVANSYLILSLFLSPHTFVKKLKRFYLDQ